MALSATPSSLTLDVDGAALFTYFERIAATLFPTDSSTASTLLSPTTAVSRLRSHYPASCILTLANADPAFSCAFTIRCSNPAYFVVSPKEGVLRPRGGCCQIVLKLRVRLVPVGGSAPAASADQQLLVSKALSKRAKDVVVASSNAVPRTTRFLVQYLRMTDEDDNGLNASGNGARSTATTTSSDSGPGRNAKDADHQGTELSSEKREWLSRLTKCWKGRNFDLASSGTVVVPCTVTMSSGERCVSAVPRSSDARPGGSHVSRTSPATTATVAVGTVSTSSDAVSMPSSGGSRKAVKQAVADLVGARRVLSLLDEQRHQLQTESRDLITDAEALEAQLDAASASLLRAERTARQQAASWSHWLRRVDWPQLAVTVLAMSWTAVVGRAIAESLQDDYAAAMSLR